MVVSSNSTLESHVEADERDSPVEPRAPYVENNVENITAEVNSWPRHMTDTEFSRHVREQQLDYEIVRNFYPFVIRIEPLYRPPAPQTRQNNDNNLPPQVNNLQNQVVPIDPRLEWRDPPDGIRSEPSSAQTSSVIASQNYDQVSSITSSSDSSSTSSSSSSSGDSSQPLVRPLNLSAIAENCLERSSVSNSVATIQSETSSQIIQNVESSLTHESNDRSIQNARETHVQENDPGQDNVSRSFILPTPPSIATGSSSKSNSLLNPNEPLLSSNSDSEYNDTIASPSVSNSSHKNAEQNISSLSGERAISEDEESNDSYSSAIDSTESSSDSTVVPTIINNNTESHSNDTGTPTEKHQQNQDAITFVSSTYAPVYNSNTLETNHGIQQNATENVDLGGDELVGDIENESRPANAAECVPTPSKAHTPKPLIHPPRFQFPHPFSIFGSPALSANANASIQSLSESFGASESPTFKSTPKANNVATFNFVYTESPSSSRSSDRDLNSTIQCTQCILKTCRAHASPNRTYDVAQPVGATPTPRNLHNSNIPEEGNRPVSPVESATAAPSAMHSSDNDASSLPRTNSPSSNIVDTARPKRNRQPPERFQHDNKHNNQVYKRKGPRKK